MAIRETGGEAMSVKYNFKIHTAAQRHSNTASGIYVQLTGERGVSNEVKLNKSAPSFPFEPDKTIDFNAEFVRDVGDVYKIRVRNDGAGVFEPRWRCDYIHVRFVRDSKKKKYRAWSEFQIAKVIEKDGGDYEFNVTGGYAATSKPGARQFIEDTPRDYYVYNPSEETITEELKIENEWNTTFRVDVSRLTSVSAGAKVEVDYKVAKAAVDVNLKSEIETKTGFEWGQKLTFSRKVPVPIPPHTVNKRLEEHWAIGTLPIAMTLGDTKFEGTDQQDERHFLGIFDPDVKSWVMKTDAFAALGFDKGGD